MLTELSDLMRRHCTPAHHFAKRLASPWMNSASPAIPAIRTIHGQRLRIHPKFLTTDLNSIEPEVMGWMQRVLRPGTVALDIGANIGLHSMYMSALVGASGSVFAFEPSPANLRLLRYHAKVNRFTQLKICEKAVSNHDGGTVPFFLLNNGDLSSNSLTFGREEIPNLDSSLHSGGRAVEVESVTIDRFCHEAKVLPDLIKIDVEGAELLVLRGCAETLRFARPRIIVAVHPWWLPPGQTTADIAVLLANAGYAIRDKLGSQVSDLDYGEYLCELRQSSINAEEREDSKSALRRS